MYNFVAGSRKIEVTLTAAHASVSRGDLEALRLLLDFRADVNSRTSLGGSLLWQAAWVGKKKVAQYLIEQGIDLDLPAISQDDSSQQYTPLHVATRQGHEKLVNLLLY